MSKTKILSTILIILILIILMKEQVVAQKDNTPVIKPPRININTPVVPVEPILIPKLESNIIYDNLEKATALAKLHQKKIAIIFSADWCQYCNILKKDLTDIAKISNLIFCVLDIEKKEINSKAIQKFKPKSLPSTIVLDGDKELSRKTGYRQKEYLLWLRQY